jgi:hypothetical protein
MQILGKDSSVSSMVESSQGNPSIIFSTFLLSECHEYLAMMRESKVGTLNIDIGTASLIAMYPDREIKDKLTKQYEEEKKKEGTNTATASVRTISEMMSCLSDVMEWTQKSYGGF